MEYFRDYLARVIVHMLNKHGKKAAEDDPAAQQVHQYTSTPAHQYTSTPIHQNTILSSCRLCSRMLHSPSFLNKDEGKPFNLAAEPVFLNMLRSKESISSLAGGIDSWAP